MKMDATDFHIHHDLGCPFNLNVNNSPCLLGLCNDAKAEPIASAVR